ncbi:hypothetical protein [Paenibacillus sp. CCS19]|uniref:hypothetical protein n=1 Tax=Paenibacillus sp. CCS19 TaxID=3158387 RepID=UPI00295F08EC|nr:hypothetical protein [Paenibacillus cellulosilyticus]
MKLINDQHATETQRKAIAELEKKIGKSSGDGLSKREAGIILAEANTEAVN